MNIIEITKEYLENKGYGGLLNCDAECCCDISDLAPCGEPVVEDCRAAYKVSCLGKDCELCDVGSCEADKDKDEERFYYSIGNMEGK